MKRLNEKTPGEKERFTLICLAIACGSSAIGLALLGRLFCQPWMYVAPVFLVGATLSLLWRLRRLRIASEAPRIE